jgi:hypothetical protein
MIFFGVHFTGEESCRSAFKKKRDKEGVTRYRFQGT